MAGKVAIVAGSKSDRAVAEKAEGILRELGIPFETAVMSAHRTPAKVRKFAAGAEADGVEVIIAIAGLAAHLPGVIASLTTVPVIGVPAEAGPLGGRDALFSIVQMPPGIPVACVGIGNAANAALLAAAILGVADPAVREALRAYRERFGDDKS